MSYYKLPDFPELTKEDLTQSFWGTQDFAIVNEAMIRAVMSYKELNEKIMKVERKRIQAEIKYKHKYRATYLSQPDSKNETWKKNISEIKCEKEEGELQYLEEISKELIRKSNEIKLEIDVLKAISFNIRQELKI